MPTVGFGRINADTSHEELVEIVAKMQKVLDYLMQGGLDSKNAREFGGWRVGNTELISKDGDVGMSTEDTEADDIRLWAGGVDKETAPWKVRKSGIMEAIGAIIGSAWEGMRVVIDDTGFHAYDENDIERITIGTTPAKGAKAIIFRDSAGVEQTVLTYDTETVDGASRTGQYVTAHGAYLLLDNSGDVRMQNASTAGYRAVGSGRPEIKEGLGGWKEIAIVEESFSSTFYNSATKDLTFLDANGNIVDIVNLT